MPKVAVVVIGGSAGSLNVIIEMLPVIRIAPAYALIFVLHRLHSADSKLTEIIKNKSTLPTFEIEEKMKIIPGNVYIAPADYHVLIENDGTFSLDYSEKVNFSRPAIDVTFQAAADVFKSALLCILLSGSSSDGVNGLRAVLSKKGIVWVQNPASTNFSYMPEQAVKNIKPHLIVEPEELGILLNKISED